MPVKPERIIIEDFKAGIYADLHGATANIRNNQNGTATTQNGAAVIEDTWRCCADQSGALGPTPQPRPAVVTATGAPITVSWPGDVSTVADRFMANFPYLYLLDGRVPYQHTYWFDPLLIDASIAVGRSIAAVYGFYYKDPAGVPLRYRYYQRGTMWLQDSSDEWVAHLSPTTRDFWFGFIEQPRPPTIAPAPNTVALGSASLFPLRSVTAAYPNDTFTNLGFAISLGDKSIHTGVMQAYETGITNYWSYNTVRPKELGIYGDQVNDGTNETNYINTPQVRCILATSHQGRLTALYYGLLFNGTYAGGVGNVLTGYDRVQYAPYLDPLNLKGTMASAGVRHNSFGDDNADLTGVMASLSNDELLLIRHRGGAVLVSGDLDNPTVKRLPFVASTGGARCHPAYSPIGLVYLTGDGVYVWEGGESSKKLSTQIEGDFWRLTPAKNSVRTDPQVSEPHGTAFYHGAEGRLTWWEPWVMVPNNWMYDTRHNSWWRFDYQDATHHAYSCYDTAPDNDELFAFPWRLSVTDRTPWHSARRYTLSPAYSWKSQPLIETTDRAVNVNDIKLVFTPSSTDGSGTTTITVTLTGVDQDGATVGPVVTTFTQASANGGRLRVMEKTVSPNFQAAYVQVKIEASQTQGTNTGLRSVWAAPKIHHISLGYRETASHRKNV